jgi:hypothetical protein
MDRFISSKQKIKYLLVVLTLFLAFGCCAFGVFSTKNAFAEEQVKTQAFLPLSSIEQYELSSPLDVYFDDEVTAILSDNNVSKSFIVYLNGEFIVNPLTSITSLKKFDRLLDNFVLFDNNILYLLSINDFAEDSTPTPLLCGNKNIGCNNFDVTNNRLSIVSGNKILVYTIENSNAIQLNANEITISNKDTPITSNSFGLYYVENGWLFFRAYDDIYNPIDICELNTNVILANDSFVYYTVGNVIHQIDLTQKTDVTLTFKSVTDDEFDLGMPRNISNLSFKGSNLLITDTSDNTIQEFKIENGELTFTGFAIADGKTAYNRISKDANKIEYYGEKIAILDQNKITIILDSAIDYDYSNFTNINVSGDNVDFISLGTSKVLAVSNNQIYTYDILTQEKSSLINTNEFEIFDVCYRNGFFYVLSNDKNKGGETYINVIDEKQNTFVKHITYENYTFNKLEIDLLGNAYFVDDTSLYIDQDFNGQTDKLLTFSDISKNKPSEIKTDLAGKVYAQIDSKLYYLNADKTDFIDVALDRTIVDFSLSFDKKSVYFVDGQSERVYSTEELNNSCIEELALPEGYTVNSSTTSIDNLIGVKVRDGANVFGYAVKGQNVTFNGLRSVESEYLKVGEILDKNSSEKFLLLVGKDQTVLVFDKDATTLNIPKNQDVPKVVYVTTPVHAYYLPKITKNQDYIANVNGEKLYIPLSSEIYPTLELTFNQTEFYFATFNIGETEYSLYVPKSFTSLSIESAKENKTFTTAKIKPTTIYLDKELKNVLTATTENLNVRLFSDKDGVLEIEYFNGETWVRGYVSGSALLNEPNTAIRNILIVLAVITCACGSITFFIIRKKQKE